MNENFNDIITSDVKFEILEHKRSMQRKEYFDR